MGTHLKTKKDQSKRWLFGRKRVIAGLILVVLAVASLVIVRSLSSPVHGSTAKLLPAAAKQVAPVAPAAQVTDTYFTLQTPEGYTVQENTAVIPGVLANSALLHASTNGTQLISIAVTKAGDGLAANTNYAVRRADPVRYLFEAVNIDGEPVSIATDSQGSGAVSFWQHDGLIATISVRSGFEAAGSGRNTEEVATIKTLLANWHWAQ